MAADGMLDWCWILRKRLSPKIGDNADAVMAELTALTLRRRYSDLHARYPHLTNPTVDERAIALFMSALYRLWRKPKAAWVLGGLGGPARGAGEILRSQLLLRPLSSEERWEEVTVHLGELLIVMTEELGKHMKLGRRALAEVCFEIGERMGQRLRDLYGLDPEGNMPAQAIEVLRVSEYIFRVNPEHWSAADADTKTGYLEGSSCPWYSRPGWHGGHCGIFGQFQAGIASVFGLSYRLTQTIPKHGGETCRIDLQPLTIGRNKREASAHRD
jgi:hypothetical protein